MPVLLIAEVPNLTEEAYAVMDDQRTPLMRASKGFICHASGPNPAGGWRVVQIWESEEDSQNWFDNNIKPILPPGIVPIQTFYPLHDVVTK